MAFEIEWLKGAQDELDGEIAYVLDEFGFYAARKSYLRIKEHVDRLAALKAIMLVVEMKKFYVSTIASFFAV